MERGKKDFNDFRLRRRKKKIKKIAKNSVGHYVKIKKSTMVITDVAYEAIPSEVLRELEGVIENLLHRSNQQKGKWVLCDFGVEGQLERERDDEWRVCEKWSESPLSELEAWPVVTRYLERQWLERLAWPNEKAFMEQSECELLRYGPGGHFATHQDRDRSFDHNAHLGTLLLILGHFAGGQLEIASRHGPHGQDLLLDTQNRAIYLPRTLEHRVTPVTQGTRWVFKLPIFVDFEAYREQFPRNRDFSLAFENWNSLRPTWSNPSYPLARARLAIANEKRIKNGQRPLQD